MNPQTNPIFDGVSDLLLPGTPIHRPGTDPADPSVGEAARVYETLGRGGLVLMQTLTGYGLVAMHEGAVRRIYELKGRPREKPCVTVGTMAVLADVATGIEESDRRFIAATTARFPLALVARRNPRSALIRSFDPFVLRQCTKDDTIATFFGVGRVLTLVAELARSEGKLVVGSSANAAGTGNNYRLQDVPEAMRERADLVLDHGQAVYTSPDKLASTILDLTRGTFLRRGAAFSEIEALYQAHRARQEQAHRALARAARAPA